MATPSALYFVIVGRNDQPIFEVDLSNPKAGEPNQADERPQYLYHFVLHAALDAVEEQEWTVPTMYLGVVDRFNNYQVSAFSTAAHVRFMLLHDGRSDEAVKGFFKDVHEAYLQVMMNPFFTFSTKITSAAFYKRVRQQGRLYFR